MASHRAYHLPDDSSTAAIDESQHVSVEKLLAVGWEIVSVAGGQDKIEQAGDKMAQESGYPVTQEGCKVPFKLDVEKHAETLEPGMADFLSKAMGAQNNHICLSNEAIVVITVGSIYLEVEDVTTEKWIRLHFVAGNIFRIPSGARYRVHGAFDEQGKKAEGIAFFKGTISNHGLLVKDEIHAHPARHAYLNTQAV